MAKVAVMGSGNGSQAMAADLTLKGHEVRLYEMTDFINNPNTKYVFDNKQIRLEGRAGNGIATISCVTSDIVEAVKGAEVIFLPLPAFSHDYYANLLAEVAEDGQIIVLTPGNLGSLVFKKIFSDKNVSADVVFCETATLNYDARILDPGHVYVYDRNYGIKCGVLPASRSSEVYEILKKYYNEFIPCEDVLACGLHSLNPCLHLPGCTMNAGRIERSKGDFYLYEEGITPTVAKVMEVLDAERGSIVKAFGYELMTVAMELAEGREPRTIWEEVNGCQTLEFIKGPTSLKNRYFTEDIPYGLVAWSELGKMLGIPTPLIDSFIEIGAIIIDEKPRETGRTLKKMGINDMTIEELKKYLGH
ncbi:NAD/NADP octopine/nopaline dehydrogenase family protein [Gallibacter sp. Marseille-QA0791]|uniref:NAD/NADP octopine/nopaline dehydrogenase family protein n=1 Tax=Gallibacter sp. Marseille-QA0791 TaxID=3378781 RepID=UPI003D0C407A